MFTGAVKTLPILAALLLPLFARAAGPSEKLLKEVDEAAAALQDESSSWTLESRAADGKERRVELRRRVKSPETLLTVLQPADVRGTAFLFDGSGQLYGVLSGVGG